MKWKSVHSRQGGEDNTESSDKEENVHISWKNQNLRETREETKRKEKDE